MDRRRPAALLGAVGVALALVATPAAEARPFGVDSDLSGIEVPVLSELPPLPENGATVDPTGQAEPSDSRLSGVQTAALVLAGSVLVAGGVGLALVTRRGDGTDQQDLPDEAPERPDPPAHPPSR